MSVVKKLSVLLIFWKILLVCTDQTYFTFLVTGGFRPIRHTLVKHIVSIQSSKSNGYFGGTHICGGAILSPTVILTAAHCVWNHFADKPLNINSLQIIARTPNRLVKTKQTAVIGVESMRVHRNYNHINRHNDIAILVLKDEIAEDNIFAQRIKLADDPAEEGMNCTVVGWGRIFDGGPAIANALYVTLQIFNTKECRESFDFVTEGMLCVGNVNSPENNVCQGDSGGPLICRDKVYGIVSFGSGCATGLPSFYVDVWYYRDWIRSSDGRRKKNIKNVLLFLPLVVWWIT